jgi:hypothetical protein
MPDFSGCAPYFSRSKRRFATPAFSTTPAFGVALCAGWLCVALLMPCAARENDKAADASTQETSESQEKSARDKKSERKRGYKEKSKATPKSPPLQIGTAQDAIRAIEELPLPHAANSSSSAAKAAPPKIAAQTKIAPPPIPSKPPRAQLPYLSPDDEPLVATKTTSTHSTFKTQPRTPTRVREIPNPADEYSDRSASGGVLAPAPLRGLPTFPSPMRNAPKAPPAGSETSLDETPDALADVPASSGNDAAQLRVGGAIARDEILRPGALVLELAARNTGTSTWLSDDGRPVRVVVRWFDQDTKRRARWEIKWLRDDIAPGQTLAMKPQISVPRTGHFTVVISLLRLSGSRFYPPANDRAELKLPGEFARAVFQTEVRAAPTDARLGGEETVQSP